MVDKMRRNSKLRKGLTCLLCLWMVSSLPMPSLADTGADSPQQQNARLGPAPQVGAVSQAEPAPQPEVLAEVPSETGGTDQSPADESKKDQAAMGSLQVEEYALFRHESSKNALDTLYQGRSGRLVVTLQSDTLMTGDRKSVV